MEAVKENRMGTAPVGPLLIKMGIPMMASMLVQAFYNVVDSIYVAQVGQEALNAVSLAYPVQNVVTAVGTGTAIGVNALISRSLGEKRPDKANRYAVNGLFLIFCSYLVILLFGLFGVEYFFRTQTTIEPIIRGGVDYLTICCCFSFGAFGQAILERILQSTGKTTLSMITQGVGAVTNIILDPILIFGWFGLPAMGTKGAAIATVTGQIISMITGLILNMKLNKEVDLSFKGFRPDTESIRDIYVIGVPSILMMLIGSVMTYLMNRMLISIEPTATAAAVFGIYFKSLTFLNMPVLGLAHAMMPIVSYNLGAKRLNRVMSAYHLCIAYATVIMVAGWVVGFFFPQLLLGFFNPSPALMEMGCHAMRIISFSYLFTSYNLVSSTFFQALGKSMISMLMSLARQLMVLVPVAYFLGHTFGPSYVWYAIPIGELGALAVVIAGRILMEKTVFRSLAEADAEAGSGAVTA